MSDSGCSGCDGGSCGSTGGAPGGAAPQGPSEQDKRLEKTVNRIRHKVVVMSGKGGVGKSTVAVNMAVALSRAGYKVGLLDVDVHGPSVPRILSLDGVQPHIEQDSMEPVPWSKNLSVMSLGFLLPAHEAVIWRGPVKGGLIRQFLTDVLWGELDFLIVDCPPGTGDEPMTVLDLLGPAAYAVVVTTPQGVAVDDVRRSITFCRQMGNPVLGVVENMAGFVCRHCGEVEYIFNQGGGERLAAEMGVPFLGSIPLDPEVVRSADEGYPLLKVAPDGPTGQAISKVIEPLGRLAEKAGTKPGPTE